MGLVGGADREVARASDGPSVASSRTAVGRLRNYLPFFVFGAVWVVVLTLFPSMAPTGRDRGVDAAGTDARANADALANGADAGSTAGGATDAATNAGSVVGSSGGGGSKTAAGAAGGAPGTNAGGGAGSSFLPPEQAAAAVQRGTGKTRLGFDCKPGMPQLPNSSYSVPCQNVYNGPNGGATYRGVTDKEILIARRKFPDTPNSRAVDAVVQQGGGADPVVVDGIRAEFVAYFNTVFELYGRTVKLVKFDAQDNSTNEQLSKGKEKACVDADKIVLEMKAFALMSAPTTTSSPMSECAAERKMPVFDAAVYFPESFYRKYHPYLWGGPMDCERISIQVAEYMGERLINKPAKWAGDTTGALQRTPRKFGTYVPDNDGYQSCVRITRKILEEKYDFDAGEQYNYQLDVSRFPDQAAAATLQFASRGVTTVVLACDAISAIVLTEAATKQKWNPEWMTIGTGLTDLDNAARLYDQVQVNGHLFGTSQLGSADKLIGANSEPGIVYKQATGKTIPDGTAGDYFTLVRIFDFLQAAGPLLTPESMAAGIRTIPPGGAPRYPAGYASYLDGPDGTPGAGDHTAVDDSREVYWVNDPVKPNKSSNKDTCDRSSDPYYNAADGCAGTYKETYGGRRFRNGEWPRETPPIYPPH